MRPVTPFMMIPTLRSLINSPGGSTECYHTACNGLSCEGR
ncbi:hypothetical protein SBA5_240027 [Candidatus Sulfotelmatomonas gaucii]|uniref:Uncharacterized protein n=1 Tax=Candidatus Sulfuritelmatomonas gaucii TaxID=2043161 RepID=A0A2N9L8S4_9BACT|nr:hypothetical protein SBA5_240027 [Candidatus Sulfotelmatomonas gaucii]